MKKKKDVPFDSFHLSSEVGLRSPVSLTDYALQDTRFWQHYCWLKYSEICHQLVNSYWCFEGSYCLHPLTVKKKALQPSKPLANIYQSIGYDIPKALNVRLHIIQTGAKQPQSFMSTSTFSETVAHTHSITNTLDIMMSYIVFYKRSFSMEY